MADELRRGRRYPLTRRMWRHAAYLGRTFPAITSWDVVNEAINPRNGKIRHSALNRIMGERFIDLAFEMMKAKAPKAQLVYNDTMNWEASPLHRDALLRLLERLLTPWGSRATSEIRWGGRGMKLAGGFSCRKSKPWVWISY
jgi:endo-1,4-beta-xylanase